MKIKIEKSEKTIKKEQRQIKLDDLKKNNKVTNEELRDLLIEILERLEVPQC